MLGSLIKRIQGSASLLSASYLLAATVLAQGIGIISMPILTRLYSPEFFGILTSYTAIVSLLAHFATGKYAQVIVTAKDDREAKILYSTAFKVAIVVGLLLFLGIAFCQFFNILPNFQLWYYLIPFTIIISGWQEGSQYFITRKKLFRGLAITKLVQSVSSVSISILVGFLQVLHSLGLVLGAMAGQIFALFASIFFLRKAHISGFEKTSFQSSLEKIKEYKNYSIFGIPGAFIDTLGQQLPVYFLMFFSNAETLGFFGLATRVVQIPGILISSSINSILFQKFSEENLKGNSLKPLVTKTSISILKVSIIPLLLFLLFAIPIFQIAFGDEWQMAGRFAKILSIIYIIRIIVSPVSLVFTVKNKLSINFIWQVCYLIGSVIFFFLAQYFQFKFENILYVFTFFEFLFYGIYFLLAYKIA